MTIDEKKNIKELRDKGYGYLKIAKELNLNVSTVKSFCQRHLKNENSDELEEKVEKPGHCLFCGEKLKEDYTPRKRKFCNDKCRMKYWNNHRELLNRKNARAVQCEHCKKDFIVYGKSERKYCSMKCYMDERFRNGEIHNINNNI